MSPSSTSRLVNQLTFLIYSFLHLAFAAVDVVNHLDTFVFLRHSKCFLSCQNSRTTSEKLYSCPMYYRWALIDSGCSRCRIAVVELNTTVPPLLSVLYATYCSHSTYIINPCNILLQIRDCWRAAAKSNTAPRSGVTLAIGHLSYCWINIATPIDSRVLFRSNIQICTIIVGKPRSFIHLQLVFYQLL